MKKRQFIEYIDYFFEDIRPTLIKHQLDHMVMEWRRLYRVCNDDKDPSTDEIDRYINLLIDSNQLKSAVDEAIQEFKDNILREFHKSRIKTGVFDITYCLTLTAVCFGYIVAYIADISQVPELNGFDILNWQTAIAAVVVWFLSIGALIYKTIKE